MSRPLSPPGSVPTILLVEDDELVSQALAVSLRRGGYTVLAAPNVDLALPVFENHPIDVVVTDLLMPGPSGFDLLRHIEQKDPDLPVVIVTADHSVQAAAVAVRERAFDYLTKPVSREQLMETVARAVRARREELNRRLEEQRFKEDHRQLAIRHQRTAMLLSVLYNRSVEGILVVDAQGRLVDASASFVSLVGQPLYELLDLGIRELFEPHPTEGDIQDRVVALASGPLAQGQWRGEVTVRNATGRQLPAKMSLSVCETPAVDGRAEQARYVIALLYYEAAYEEISRQLQAADRLATIGLLAGSAAHEIKNELGPLLGYLSMIERAGDKPVDAGMTKIMRESIRRVQEHVEHILEPLRPRVRTRGAVIIAECVENILALLRRAGRLRRLSVDLQADEEVVVHADKDEVHQIALNLITNAIDALPDGQGADRGTVRIRLSRSGEHGVLQVQDTGVGIAANLRARVFEPFFTTKGAAGTGLGLAVVHDIVRSLRGRVALDSAPEGGTIITVSLPLYRPDLA